MKHFFTAESDYAASGWNFCKALAQVVSEQTRMITARQSVFAYPSQAPFDRHTTIAQEVRDGIEWADWIHIVQSVLPRACGGVFGAKRRPQLGKMAPYLALMEGKRIAVYHGGSYYRQAKQHYSRFWSTRADLSVCYSADLLSPGVYAHEVMMLPPVDFQFVPGFRETVGEPIIVGHYPARPVDKGSEEILEVLRAADDEGLIELRTSVVNPNSRKGAHRATWPDQIARMAACDVIVDQIMPDEGGLPLGEWVSLTTEAAACGCIVLTNSHRPEAYRETYGEPPGILIANTATELREWIWTLAEMDAPTVLGMRRWTREWAERQHALVPTGKRLLANLSCC